MPVIAVAIAGLPTIALLLSLVSRMEASILSDLAEDRPPVVN